MKKKTAIQAAVFILASLCTMTSCSSGAQNAPQETKKATGGINDGVIEKEPDITAEAIDNTPIPSKGSESILRQEGTTVETRFLTPSGYTRIKAATGSFTSFVRNYPLKEDGASVLLYDGTEKANQSCAAAVFAMKLGNRDLQQCADSIIRMYAEYEYENKKYEKIQFHFVDGFLCTYKKWMEGYRVTINGDKAGWKKSAGKDTSYENFEKYLNVVFAYASTMSLDKECSEVSFEEAKVGDVFIKAGSPGHVVMVVDVCENEQGKKAVLLAQGYMPAQEFHVINNPLHRDDPWYYEEEITYPLRTAEYTFPEGSFKRPEYEVEN